LSLEFTYTGNETDPDALCVLFNKVFSNNSTLPNKRRSHPEYKYKHISFFKRKFDLLNYQSLTVKRSKTYNENSTEASYRVSYRIALAQKAHTFAETLIKPCAVEIATCVLVNSRKRNLKEFSYLIILLHVAFKICQQMQKNNWCRALNPASLFRFNLMNQQTCHG
jgi:hypothetical protein